MDNQENDFEGWAILEIMGHQRFAGRISTQTVAGTAMVRLDVPEVDGIPAWTKCFGGSALYGLTPVSEEVATAMAAKLRAEPVNTYEFPENVREAFVRHCVSEIGNGRYDADDPVMFIED